jgi:hypothetical protein
MTASGSRTWPGLRAGTNRPDFCRHVVLVGKDGADEADVPLPADRTGGSTNLAARVGRVTESGKRPLEGFNDMAIMHSRTGSAAE